MRLKKLIYRFGERKANTILKLEEQLDEAYEYLDGLRVGDHLRVTVDYQEQDKRSIIRKIAVECMQDKLQAEIDRMQLELYNLEKPSWFARLFRKY